MFTNYNLTLVWGWFLSIIFYPSEFHQFAEEKERQRKQERSRGKRTWRDLQSGNANFTGPMIFRFGLTVNCYLRIFVKNKTEQNTIKDSLFVYDKECLKFPTHRFQFSKQFNRTYLFQIALCNCNTRSYYHYVFEPLSIRYIFLMWISQIFRRERKAMQTKKIKRKEKLERLGIHCWNFHAILRYIYMYVYVSTNRWEQSSKVNYYEN